MFARAIDQNVKTTIQIIILKPLTCAIVENTYLINNLSWCKMKFPLDKRGGASE